MRTQHLPLSPRHTYHTEWLVTHGNELAYEAVQKWIKGLPPRQFIITGPCSKTFLAQLAAQTLGVPLLQGQLPPLTNRDPVVLDDADHITHSLDFLHWYNEVGEHHVPVLYTALESPQHWPHQLPDLVSRLRTLPIVCTNRWTDEELALLLPRMMKMQGLNISEAAVHFALQHIERSFGSFRRLVDFAHRYAPRRNVSRNLVKEFISAFLRSSE